MREPAPHPFAGIRELEPPAHRPIANALRDLGTLETAADVIREARRLLDAGLLSLPLPARGDTARRFHAFAELAATGLARALGTARDGDAQLLFDVDLEAAGIERVAGSWQAVGMATTDSLDVIFEDVEVDDPVGAPGFYLERPGFWHGAVGVAACWYGGALGALRMLRGRSATMTAHQSAHLGGVVAACETMRRILDGAAGEIDDSSGGEDHGGRWRALVVRHVVEQGCQDVLERVGRAGGTSPLVFDRAHAKRAADLLVYLRQHHAARDLSDLGQLAVSGRCCGPRSSSMSARPRRRGPPAASYRGSISPASIARS